MKASARIRNHNLARAMVVALPDQHRAARALRPEWQNFLDESDFAFQHDALSKELVSLEAAGLEEEDTRAVFGFEPDAVSSGVRVVCDSFYEEDSADFMAG